MTAHRSILTPEVLEYLDTHVLPTIPPLSAEKRATLL